MKGQGKSKQSAHHGLVPLPLADMFAAHKHLFHLRLGQAVALDLRGVVGRAQACAVPEPGKHPLVQRQGRHGLAGRFDPHEVARDCSGNGVTRLKRSCRYYAVISSGNLMRSKPAGTARRSAILPLS
jgi:hypothetical protein